MKGIFLLVASFFAICTLVSTVFEVLTGCKHDPSEVWYGYTSVIIMIGFAILSTVVP